MYLSPNDLHLPLPGKTRKTFYVAETLLVPGSGLVNEDTLAVRDNLAVVCDGASSLTKSWPDGGLRAARITARSFIEEPTADLLTLARRANERIHRSMKRSGVDLSLRESLWATSFAAVRWQGEVLEWCQSGDCMVMLIFSDGSARLLTSLPNQDAALLQKWRDIGEKTSGSISENLGEAIKAVRRQMNRSFGVLNGEPEAPGFVKIGSVRIEQVSDILLFSDGLFPPNPKPREPFNHQLLSRWYRDAGLAGVKEEIRRLENTDPRCYRYPRFKQHDDISAIALRRA